MSILEVSVVEQEYYLIRYAPKPHTFDAHIQVAVGKQTEQDLIVYKLVDKYYLFCKTNEPFIIACLFTEGISVERIHAIVVEIEAALFKLIEQAKYGEEEG